MPALKNNAIMVAFKTTRDTRERLRHHAKRIGTDMNDIVREATLAHLDQLDEKELRSIEVRRLQRQRASNIPEVVKHKWGKPGGLGARKLPEMPTLKIALPSNLERSFRRYAEHVEKAASDDDKKARAQTIVEDMRQRASSPAEADAMCEAFTIFLQERAAARLPKRDIVDASSAAIVEGSADD